MNRIKYKEFKRFLWPGIFIAAVSLFASCKITKTYQQPADAAGNKLYRNETTNDTATIADIPWKEILVIRFYSR